MYILQLSNHSVHKYLIDYVTLNLDFKVTDLP